MAVMKSKLLIACLAFALAPLAAIAQVSVKDPWVRGTVAGQKATGAFMQITSGSDASLVAVTSPAAKVVEIHSMTHDGGVMKMRAIETLALPAGKPVDLSPGGYHVMLMDLKQPLVPGSTVPLTLVLRDGKGVESKLELKVPVAAAPSGGHKH